MKEIFASLLKFLSQIPTTVLFLTACGVSWLLLLAPTSMVEFLGLKHVCDSHRSVIGLVALSSTTILLIFLLFCLSRRIRGCLIYSGRDARRRLDSMSAWARGLIRQLYESDSHALKLPLQNANVAAMVSEGVLKCAQLGDALGFECVLQPWVVAYLKKHPDYLESIKPLDRPYSASDRFCFI